MILESVKNGPLIWPSIEENGVTRPKKYSELCSTKAIQADCDVKATNIILQGLPPKVYALCKLYDEFDKFAYKKGETLRDFYLRFSLLLNDMNIYNMKLEQFQVNTKFLNTLPPEWSKFVTDVKLVRDLHTTNIDQLHVYLGQHEFHANETLQYGLPYQSQQYSTHQSSTPLSITYPSNDYQSFVHHNVYSPSSSITQLEYAPRVNQQPEFSQPDSDLIVLVSQKGYDPFDAINHIMTYILGASGSNSGKQRTVICYNCKGEGHMSKQCTKPKRKQDDSWFKDKVFLVQAQANGQILHEEELAFLADSGIAEVALMANLSHYGSDALAKKAQQLEPKLYDGNVIKNTSAIVIPDFEETLMLAEESHFERRFVPQTELSAEQAFWSQNYVNSPEPTLFSRPTKVEVPKELPKVSMVNTSLKKLKHHLAGFDVVVKERTTPTSITEGSWGSFFRISPVGVKPSTSASGSQPSGNTKKDKNRQTPSSTQKNKVEAHPRKVESSLKNKDCVVKPKGTAHMQHSKLNANSELKCVKITTTTEVPLKKPTALENETPKPVVTLVYSRKPRKSKTNVPVSKSKVLKSVSANKKGTSDNIGDPSSDVPSSSL
ncbi:RNA-directed DNA polymerase, eukaryota [Tanacetum coccineum]